MNRRQLFKSAVLGAGAAASASAQERIHVHLETLAPAQAAAMADPDWTPAVLDEHQNETVIVFSELIIPETDTPGAKAANVNRWVDLYLKDLSEDNGHAFLMGLGWLDGYTHKLHGQPFVKLTEEQQVAILETLDSAEDEELETGAELFEKMKELTVQGYYTTKIGMDELNKNGVPDSFACTHESHA